MFTLTEGSSPSMLPKLIPLPCPCKFDGGRPPLAGGCGMGEGEFAGEVILGFDGDETANEFGEGPR